MIIDLIGSLSIRKLRIKLIYNVPFSFWSKLIINVKCFVYCLFHNSHLDIDCDILAAYCNNKHYSYKITVDFLIKLITADNSSKHHLVHVQCRCTSNSVGTAVGTTNGWPVLFILLPTIVKQTFNYLLLKKNWTRCMYF